MKKRIGMLVMILLLSGFVTEKSLAAEEPAVSATETTENPTTQTGKEPEVTKPVVKKGNCDHFIGLSGDYRVLATARKKVKVYQKPSAKSKVLGKFTKNNCIVVNTKGMKKGRNYRWLKVYLKNKKTGYLPVRNIALGRLNIKNFGLKTSSKKNRQRIKICQYGLPYMGTDFVLGGNSLTRGIDCSSFARRAMRNAGVRVGSHALAVNLSYSGKKIRRSQLKPGDMVFYYNSYRDRRIGHCAIYIGSGYIINASGHQGHHYPSGGIRISRIDYRKPTAVRFRNLVGN